jgi:Ca-activated chloride channel family protein
MSRHRFPSPSRASLVVACGLVLAPLGASADAPADRTGSAYFLVTSDGPGDEALPLEESRADVDVAGVIAHVRLTQVYRNRGGRALEALYVFPGSTRAAVFGMRMKIGDRTIEADVEEREAARETYEAARESGKTASLLEQERPNVFQMSVANILPGDVVRVELDYTEILVPADGVYELVVPAVVGPRYTGEQARPEAWHSNPHLREGEVEPYRFGLAVALQAGIPIQELASPSHTIAPRFGGKGRAELALGSPGDGNRDFVLRYRLRGGEIETGLLRFAGAKENFFLLMLQPPARAARAKIPPREYVFLVDVSGSMTGFPLEVAKGLMRDLLRGLRLTDRFNILFFSGGSYQLSERSVPASEANITRALRVLDQVEAGGGTELLGAIRTALAMPSEEGTSRTFVAITDGYVSIEAEAFRLVRRSLGVANFFAFGIGSSVNRHLIEGLARAGAGEPFVVEDQAQAPRQAQRFRKMIESPILTDIEVAFRRFDAYEVEPPAIPDLLAERPLVIVGKYRGAGAGTVTVRGAAGDGPFERTLRASDSAPDPRLRALPYLWARHRIAGLSDLETLGGEPQRDSILGLGLRYHLMTQYTSFVAVDRFRRRTGELVSVKQPLPLPQGVSRYALSEEESAGESIQVIGSAPAPLLARWGRDEAGAPVDVRSAALSARTVGRMGLEIGQRLEWADTGAARGFGVATLFRFGATERLEARLGSSLAWVDDSAADSPDLTTGAKLQLFDSGRIAAGLLGDVQLDFDGDTPERSAWRGGLLVEAALASRLALRANLAALYLGRDDDSRLGLGYAAELALAVTDRWLAFAAASGLVTDDPVHGVEGGASYLVTGGWLVGLSAGAGLSDAADDVSAGLFLRWQL